MRLSRGQAATFGFAALMLAFAAVVLAATAYHARYLRSVELGRLRDAAATHARVFEEHVSQSLTVVDLTLRNALEAGVTGAGAEVSASLALALRRAPYLRSLSLVNADGRVVASSNPDNIGIEPQLGRLLPETAAGAPLLRIGGAWAGRDFAGGRATTEASPAPRDAPGFVPVVRALDASLRLVAAVNPDYFVTHFVNALPAEEGSVQVLNLEGTLLFGSDESPSAPTPGMRHVPHGVRPTAGLGFDAAAMEPTDDGAVEVAARTSRLYPLTLLVRLDREAALQSWRQQLRTLLASVVPAFLLSLGLSVAVFRRVQRVERERQNEELRAADRLAGRVLESATEAIVVTDPAVRIVRVNRAYSLMSGYTEAEVVGRNPSINRSEHQSSEFYASMWRALSEKGAWKGELVNRRKDGASYPVALTISAVRDEAGRVVNYVGLFSDITERKAREERIRFLSEHDFLTGLPNRALFQDRVRQSIAHARRAGRHMAVLFIDLDRFKSINDSFGHHAGDQLLQEVAKRLRAALRESDTVGRQGGDEFLVMLPDLNGPEGAASVVEKLMAVISEPYSLNGRSARITPSIGISVFPDDGEDLDTLVRAADTAMYHSKASGRAAYHFYSAEMNTVISERLALEAGLRRALEQGALRLQYQPLVDLVDGEVNGVEALLRWRDPTLGEIAPQRFIPLAEECGLIVPIGEWVLREACRQLHAWTAAGLEPLRVSVNVAATQFASEGFVPSVLRVLDEHGLDGSALELEVTESMLVDHEAERVQQFNALRAAGIRVSIDDFGTGYSSLSYLRRLPIDKIKIDRSFVADLVDDPEAALIVAALIDMAHGIGLRVLGEGVETQAQLDFLRQRDCDAAQGYLISRPLEPDALAQWLRSRRAVRAGLDTPESTLA